MKKVLLVFITALLMTNAFSQGFSGGFFVGPTTSWVSTDSRIITPEKVNLGYTFGATADIRFFDNFDLSLGLRFNNIGGSLSFNHGALGLTADEVNLPDTLYSGSSMKYNLNYLAIPVGFKGKTNEIGYITYFLKGGVTPMINTKAQGDIATFTDLIIDDHVKLFNLGWHIGGGIEYALAGSTRLLVEVIYTGGLVDFSDFEAFTNEDMNETRNPKTTISDIHLKVGILF